MDIFFLSSFFSHCSIETTESSFKIPFSGGFMGRGSQKRKWDDSGRNKCEFTERETVFSESVFLQVELIFATCHKKKGKKRAWLLFFSSSKPRKKVLVGRKDQVFHASLNSRGCLSTLFSNLAVTGKGWTVWESFCIPGPMFLQEKGRGKNCWIR